MYGNFEFWIHNIFWAWFFFVWQSLNVKGDAMNLRRIFCVLELIILVFRVLCIKYVTKYIKFPFIWHTVRLCSLISVGVTGKSVKNHKSHFLYARLKFIAPPFRYQVKCTLPPMIRKFRSMVAKVRTKINSLIGFSVPPSLLLILPSRIVAKGLNTGVQKKEIIQIIVTYPAQAKEWIPKSLGANVGFS